MSLLGKQRIRVLKSWISKIKGFAEVLENVLVNHGEEVSNINICDSGRIKKMKSGRKANTQYLSKREGA